MLDRWLGVKHVIYNVTDPTLGTTSKQEIWLDRDVSDAEGNLRISNNWIKVSEFTDTGGWYCDPFSDCAGCSLTGADQVVITPGGNNRSGTTNYHRNCATIAWDQVGGVQQVARFKFFSVREIDSTKYIFAGSTPGQVSPGNPFDAFGVKKIYPTKGPTATIPVYGTEWYMNRTNFTDDPQIFQNTNTFSKNSDGSHKCTDTSVKIQVVSAEGYNAGLTHQSSQDHTKLSTLLGNMQGTGDWRNVEMTIYFRINAMPSMSFPSYFQLWCRGGRHVDTDPNLRCEGTGMHGLLGNDGSTKFYKEQYHVSLVSGQLINEINESLLGKWVGMKYVVFNRTFSDGTYAVVQEVWADINNDNNWVMVGKHVDAGGQGADGQACGGLPDQRINWGGPIAGFSWSIFEDVDFDKLSIREIEQDAIPIDQPEAPQVGACGSL
jgi:hypothetical protein